MDGRRFVPELVVRAVRRADGKVDLFAPRPGLWRGAPEAGDAVAPGASIGELEVLGVLYRLRVPEDVYGALEATAGKRLARRPVDARTHLGTLDPSAASGERAQAASSQLASASGGPVFRTPLGGRYYARPSPAADPFVRVGDPLAGGETVALIEVMKTFNRVAYTGPRARVKAVARKDGDDVEGGDVLLELEAIED